MFASVNTMTVAFPTVDFDGVMAAVVNPMPQFQIQPDPITGGVR